ncbi:SprT-like domain-containing protein [Micromonospora carbonacea]|uniref:SprT-like domain-containing protein n=1 Tax=Micromonospora carbonacea TaxID=47853 RepID=UPI003D7156F2
MSDTYDRLNALCFGGRLRPVVIRLEPWILSIDTPGLRLAGAWDSDGWSIAIDRALLDHPRLLVGALLHEMVHQACHQAAGVGGHGPFFVAAAALAGGPLDIPGPTPATASTWPYPIPRQLLKEI